MVDDGRANYFKAIQEGALDQDYSRMKMLFREMLSEDG